MPRDFEPATATPSSGAASLLRSIAIVLRWNTGFKGARVAAALYGLEPGAQPFDIGLLLATFAVCPLLPAIHAGRIADRYGAKLPMVAGAVVSAAGVLLP